MPVQLGLIDIIRLYNVFSIPVFCTTFFRPTATNGTKCPKNDTSQYPCGLQRGTKLKSEALRYCQNWHRPPNSGETSTVQA